MSTRIGLLSDVHAKSAPVAEALSIFKHEQVDSIICPGDIAGYFDDVKAVIDLLVESNCQTIIGNHDQSYIESHQQEKNSAEYRFLDALPETLEYEIEGRRVYVVHAHPPTSQHGGIKLLDVDGELIPEQKQYWQQALKDLDYDVLIVGHTHQVFVEQLGDVLVINPGSTQFNHTCMILTLPEMTVQTFALQGKDPVKSWNWGKFIQNE